MGDTQFPFSRFAEAIRAIKLAVDLNGDVGNASKVIGFTSSIPNEGKSTIAASLALLMAQVGARVILVDCDLRNPTLSRKLAPNADCGLLDVIVGTTPLEDAMWRDASTNLAFLPAGIRAALPIQVKSLRRKSTQRLFSESAVEVRLRSCGSLATHADRGHSCHNGARRVVRLCDRVGLYDGQCREARLQRRGERL